jgi:hypothetical protein
MELRDVEEDLMDWEPDLDEFDEDDDFDSGAEDDDEDNVIQALDVDNVHVLDGAEDDVEADEVSDDENEQHELQVVFETHPVDWQQAHDFSNYWPAEEARSLDMATEQWEQYNAEQRRLVYEALWHGFHKWLMASSALDETRFNEAVWELEHMEVLLHCFDLTSECGRFRVQFLFDTTPTRVLRVGIAYRGPACLILRSNFSDSDDEDEL